MGNPFERKADTINPWTDEAQAQVINPLTGGVAGNFANFDWSKAQDSFNPLFSGQQAQSLMQGSKGYLGQAGGMFGSGQNALRGNANGANDWLSSVLNPSFTDINNNPQVKGVLDAMVNQGQRGFNIGADKIASNAAQTSSGLGKGTATTDALSGLGANISSNLSDQTANFLQGELARRQGLQANASQQSLGDRLGMANAYGNLGQGLGQLGISQGGLGLDMGKYIGQQNQMGANFGLEQMFRLAGLLKSGQSIAQPSMWDNVNSVVQTAGDASKAGASIAALSDERAKESIVEIKSELIHDFMDQINPSYFEYIYEAGPNYGVMAQDLEKSEIGSSIVFEKEGLKHIDVVKSVGLLLATVSSLHKRIKELENA